MNFEELNVPFPKFKEALLNLFSHPSDTLRDVKLGTKLYLSKDMRFIIYETLTTFSKWRILEIILERKRKEE
jgi:hypothetical protein